MYLLILEDNSMAVTNELTDEMVDSCGAGYMDIVDISDPNNPKAFYPINDVWLEIERV
jgi:hypothetical protein